MRLNQLHPFMYIQKDVMFFSLTGDNWKIVANLF